MKLAAQLHELAVTRRHVRRAERRLEQCRRDGHLVDEAVPSPPGRFYCGRCRARYPNAERPA